jgi:hypothetical protein
LREAERPWLEQEIKKVLAYAAPKETSSIAERIRREGEQNIEGSEVDSNYQAREHRYSAEPEDAGQLKKRLKVELY